MNETLINYFDNNQDDIDNLLSYFKGDELAATTWVRKYAYKAGGEKTPDDMHRRMAKEFARIDLIHQKNEDHFSPDNNNLSDYGNEREDLTEEIIYQLFKNFKYIIPQGSIMSQLGVDSIGSLSNCFVIGQPEDSYGGIFQKDEEQAQLMKRRGGVGQDISTLRPEGTLTSNAAHSSTGAVSFMHRFSNTTNEVAQNGRRGALMLSIDINHPDVMEFIKVKRDLTKVTGANISIKLNSEFMKAVENDEDYILRFPCDLKYEDLTREDKIIGYNELKDCGNGRYIKRIKAKEYWDEIIKSAHASAEPGLMFWDNMVELAPDGAYPQFKPVTTNPCSEIGMQPYDACRLIAQNFYSYVINPFTPKARFDMQLFAKHTYEAMRLSDNLIELELEHIKRILDKIDKDPESENVKAREKALWQKIYVTAKSSRRTGLGFTALGDTLAALGLKYDSDEALKMVDSIMYTKQLNELRATIDLAQQRGAFPGWKRYIEYDDNGVGTNEFYKQLKENFPEEVARMNKFGRRNVSWSTAAPTGTVSLLAQTTSGIEPLFMPYYFRNTKVDGKGEYDFQDEVGIYWKTYPVFHPKFKDWYFTQMYKGSEDDSMLESASKEDLEYYFSQSPYYQSTANDIDWIKRVEMQSLLQKYITHSISSTINLPKNVETESVSEIYMEAWKKGLKGITVYRDGSRSGVLVANNDKKSDKFDYRDAVKRPKELEAQAHVSSSKGISYHVLIGLLDNKPYEIFIDNSANKYSSEGRIVKEARGKYFYKNGGDPVEIRNFMTPEQQAITRLVSMSLRHGTAIQFVVDQLYKIDSDDMFNFTRSLARVLKKYIENGKKASGVSCTECGSDENIIFEEGCHKCLDCGSSKCG